MTINLSSTFKRFNVPLLLGMALASLTGNGQLEAQTTVGSGSYATSTPSGATALPTTIYKSYSGPVATHKFWTAQNWVPLTGPQSFTMEPQPLTIQTVASGLALGYSGTVVSQSTYFYKSHQQDMILGVNGLNASSATVSAYSDWSATLSWGTSLSTTVGRGMPFVYATTSGTNITITFPTVPTVFSTNSNILGVTINGNSYALFGPTGATWSGQGSTKFTCTLPSGKLYFSLALLPSQSALSTYTTYAFAFPTNTKATWSYNQANAQVSTTYTVTTTAKEGSSTGTVMALYPHHYDSGAAVNTSYTYASTRGTMKVTMGSSFTTTDTYTGVIPFQPPVGAYNASTMQSYLDTVVNGSNYTYDETYGVGKQLARVAHVLPIAKALGTSASATSLSSLQSGLKAKFNSWFTATGKTTDLFYYNSNWGTLIGIPGSYGSDTTLADHHFHYGYWIHAAAILGLFDTSWMADSSYGGMVNMLAADIATTTRGDSKFPFLRSFDVYEGHSWASGNAPFGDGNNCESSSESMNAWAGLIIWATAKGNTTLRDAAIWMYTIEANAIKHYWFDYGTTSTFPAAFSRVQVANLFDGKSDAGTWFGTEAEYAHGIEFLPFTGGSNYLGVNPTYCQQNMAEVLSLTGRSAISPTATLWPDIMEMYQSYYDPSTSLSQWASNTYLFDGESKAHEYYWLTNMVALGKVDATVTANTPLYAVYKNSAGTRTHVAYNTDTTSKTVTFSDGVTLTVPAGSLMSDTKTVTTGSGSSSGGGTTTAPAAVTNLTATAASSSQINLSWTASSTSGATYSVYRSTTSGFTPSTSTLITSGLSATSYSNTGLSASTTYYYIVAAVNSVGSTNSSQVSAKTSASGTTTAPTAVTNLSASVTSSSSITLTWTASTTSGATYSVYRSTTSGFTPSSSTLITSGLSATSYANTGLTASTTYYFIVAAVNTVGSTNSSQISATTSAASTTAPAAPTGVTATALSTTSIKVSWTASTTSGVTYSVYRSTASGFTPANTNLVGSALTTTTFTDTLLVANIKYYYKVAAVNSAGTTYAAEISCTTLSNTTISSIYINCGGSANGSYIADAYYSGGSTSSTTTAINTSLLNVVPPQSVLQTCRYGKHTYTINGFTAGKSYNVGLYFSENYWSAAGKRKFNVAINGTTKLTNFDIYATVGAKNKATVQYFAVTANSTGQIIIAFTNVVDNAQINGIMIQ